MLFHEDIFYNIKYGRPTATDEEVHEAAKLAELDERCAKLGREYMLSLIHI